MIHKITYPFLILLIIGLGIFVGIKSNEAEKQNILAMEMAARAERLQEQAQASAARPLEEAGRADLAMKEAETQALIAQEQAFIAEKERFDAQRLREQLEACAKKK